MTFNHFPPVISRIHRMAGHHLMAYTFSPTSLVLYMADTTVVEKLHASTVMVIEGARQCWTQVLPFLSRLHRCLTFLYYPSSS
jgi:hypothetical protein